MLIDINVLLALAWPNHQFHAASRTWFSGQRGEPWSTCAVTQLGFIRISSNPAFTDQAVTPAEAARLLGLMTEQKEHAFLESPAQPWRRGVWSSVGGHRQVTDAHLVAVAREHGTMLATFDLRLARSTFADSVVVVPT
ncbi:MAG TPA: PIN domain-containing protein [Myxococcales bacterium LLY-WYZ-16_1]|jgi:uncharacterized protein|nr:PIN domain-containing protein [Myxococcales bacterium LLY-WYZ-16_1]